MKPYIGQPSKKYQKHVTVKGFCESSLRSAVCKSHIRACGLPFVFLFRLLCVCLRGVGSGKHMFVFTPMCLRQRFKHGCTKEPIIKCLIQLIYPSSRMSWIYQAAPVMELCCWEALRWSSIKTQYNNYKLTQETRQGSFLWETACFVNHNLFDK